MNNKTGFIEGAMRHRQIVLLVSGILMLLGVYALMHMPRQEFPEFTIRQGLVIGVYPGASAGEVENQLTQEVEKYLFGFKEIKRRKTYSVSRDGMMIVFVELNDRVKSADEFWSKLNHGLNTFKSSLPSGVLALMADNDFGQTSALLITLESDQRSYRELETYLKELENRLRRVESVSKIRHYGLQTEQISIYLNPEKLSTYGITTSTLLGNLFLQGFTTVSGNIDNQRTENPIHIAASYQTEEEIGEQIVYSDPQGNLIRLRDVAGIVREYPQPESYIQNNGRKSLLISMEMQPGNNIVQYGAEVDQVLKTFQEELPKDVHILRIADQPEVVRHSVASFLKEFFLAILAVILVTMLLLPFRVASVAATTIPMSIFISLAIMYLGGMELNTVTLAALIVVLGMIVDNSIVIIDSYLEKIGQGVSRWHASISSAREFFKAIFSATLAISITFFPFLFTLTGQFNDFVQMFPWTVTITLGISLLVAMMIIPYLQFFIIRKGISEPSGEKKGRSLLAFIQNTYERWLHAAFRHPVLTLSLGFVAIAAGALLFLTLPQRLMPLAERNQFAVEITLPQGSSLTQTAAVADSMEHILRLDSRILSVTSFIGSSSPRFHTNYAPSLPASNYAQFIVNTLSNEATEEVLDEYANRYPDYFPNARIRFKQLDFQAVAAPIEVRLSGNDLGQLRALADSMSGKLRGLEGIGWVRTNFGEKLPGARVELLPLESNRLGINKTTVSTNLAAHFQGVPLTTLWEEDYALPVELRMQKEGEASLQDLREVYVHSVIPGVSVPLRQVASIEPEWSEGQIVRRNGIRTISVMADVLRGYNINRVFGKVHEATTSFSLPDGVSLSFGGAAESDAEDLPEIMKGLAISLCIIFFILLFHFRKINLALLVMGSAALSLAGAAIGVRIMNVEIGITAILGIVSLTGILVRNGIIMLDYAESLRLERKMTAREAAFEAGKRRMRPIFLTSAAASMGVIPMIISNSPLWGPMGTLICFGTMTSMILLVLMMPVSYWLIFRRADRRADKKNQRQGSFAPAVLGLLLIAGISAIPEPASAQKTYTLEECKRLVEQNHARLRNARLSLDASEEVRKAAFTRYFPTVNATGISFRASEPMLELKVPGGNLPVYDGNPAHLLSATQFAYFPGMDYALLDKGNFGAILAVQPVYAGRRISAGNQLAKVGVEASRSQVQLTRSELLLKTEETYLQLTSLREKTATLHMLTALLDTLHRQASDACQAGLVQRNDVLRVEMKQSELSAQKLRLENGILLSSMALCQYIGEPYTPGVRFSEAGLADSTVSIPVLEASVQALYSDPATALLLREEYKLLENNVQAESLRTRMKKGEYLPELAVGARGLYMDMGHKGTGNALAFATLNIPVSGWWEASHALKEQRLREEMALNEQKDAQERMLLQMQQTWNELNEAMQQVKVARKVALQAVENLRLNRDNYEAGIISISDMLEAQVLLLEARNKETDARLELQLKKMAYLHSTGRYE